MEYKKNNLLAILSLVAIFIVVVNLTVIFIKIADFNRETTGRVAGLVNITVNSFIMINMAQDNIDFGGGAINSSFSNATLFTRGNNNASVLRGNWSGENAKAFIVQNIGTLDSSLYIQTGKDAQDLFNSSSNSNEEYKINVTNKKPNSCSGGAQLGIWNDVNKTNKGTKYCSVFSSNPNSNEIYIDVLLTVPWDSGVVGNVTDSLTITAYVAEN